MKEPISAIPILLIDDDINLHNLLNAVIRVKNIPAQLYTAKNAKEGVSCYNDLLEKNTEPAIVLMDLRMPGTNGVTATQQIKEINKDANVFMLTAYEDAPEIKEALDAGAKGVIKKVANYTSLIAVIAYTVAHALSSQV